MRAKSAWLMRIFQQLEIFRKRIELRHVTPLANQQVARFVVDARELIDDVANVGAQAVIPGTPYINGHAHLFPTASPSLRARLARDLTLCHPGIPFTNYLLVTITTLSTLT